MYGRRSASALPAARCSVLVEPELGKAHGRSCGSQGRGRGRGRRLAPLVASPHRASACPHPLGNGLLACVHNVSWGHETKERGRHNSSATSRFTEGTCVRAMSRLVTRRLGCALGHPADAEGVAIGQGTGGRPAPGRGKVCHMLARSRAAGCPWAIGHPLRGLSGALRTQRPVLMRWHPALQV